MKRRCIQFVTILLLLWALPGLWAADAAPAAAAGPEAAGLASTASAEAQRNAAAAAVVTTTTEARTVHRPGFLEHLVDSILEALDVRNSGNTATHYGIAMVLLVGAFVLRRVVTGIIFRGLKKLAARTATTLDDKLFPALESPAATFIMLAGIFAAFSVLKLSADSDRYLAYASTMAFSLVVFWGLWSAFTAVLDHAHEIAVAKSMSIAAFMPWIRKSLMVIFAIVGTLMVIQSFGYDVKALLAGLGIGGLAFALAAQDTLANVFGSIVVAIDQPFKLGEVVRIGQTVGAVEDIGLRSTRLRLIDKSLMTIPNKTVAAEMITNLSRFTRRRFEQVIGLTYSTKPADMAAILEDIRNIITSQPEVDKPGVMVFFRDFSASSLDIWVVYEVPAPDFQQSMRVKQRINLAIMGAVEARGLSFAFPTQTIEFAGAVAAKLADRDSLPPASGKN